MYTSPRLTKLIALIAFNSSKKPQEVLREPHGVFGVNIAFARYLNAEMALLRPSVLLLSRVADL